MLSSRVSMKWIRLLLSMNERTLSSNISHWLNLSVSYKKYLSVWGCGNRWGLIEIMSWSLLDHHRTSESTGWSIRSSIVLVSSAHPRSRSRDSNNVAFQLIGLEVRSSRTKPKVLCLNIELGSVGVHCWGVQY